MGRQKSNHLDPAEWDFRDIEDERELRFCLEYELSRELQSEAWRNWITEFRSDAKLISIAPPRKQFDELLAWARKCEGQHPEGQLELSWPKTFETVWPEWPDQPYQKVETAERNYRRRRWTAIFESDQEDPLEVVPLGELMQRREDIVSHRNSILETGDSDFDAKIAEMTQRHADFLAQDPLSAELGKAPAEISPIFRDTFGDVVAFRITAWESNETIKERFAKWLNARRMEIEGDATKKREGGISKIEKDLRSLGAWRLERCFGNGSAARTYAELQGRKPPYQKGHWNEKVKYASQSLGLGNPRGRRR